MAFVALSPSSQRVGIDAEPVGRMLAENAFDLMARGEELERLREEPVHVFRAWTGKEAVQKCLGRGMHLNPREIEIPIEGVQDNISIGNLNFQLRNLNFNGYNISVAIGRGNGYDAIPEDELLRQTQAAMNDNPDWSIGCKTTRSNA